MTSSSVSPIWARKCLIVLFLCSVLLLSVGWFLTGQSLLSSRWNAWKPPQMAHVDFSKFAPSKPLLVETDTAAIEDQSEEVIDDSQLSELDKWRKSHLTAEIETENNDAEKRTKTKIDGGKRRRRRRHVETLILMVDDRLQLANERSEALNLTRVAAEHYWWYTLAINLHYARQRKYALAVVKFPEATDAMHACRSRYAANQLSSRLVPTVWCRLDVISYFLERSSIILDSAQSPLVNEKEENENDEKNGRKNAVPMEIELTFSWLLWLDSDSHMLNASKAVGDWLPDASARYDWRPPQQLHFVTVNDPPLFVKREAPRLKAAMRRVADAQCDTYVNAGTLLIRNSAVSIQMMQLWSASINKVPTEMVDKFPREQGALNCFVTAPYSQFIARVPAFGDINLDRFLKYDGFIQHITSGYPMYRIQRFAEFIQKTIEADHLKVLQRTIDSKPDFTQSVNFTTLRWQQHFFLF